MEGIERLEMGAQEMNDYNVIGIVNYLKTRTDLYEKFNNEEKTVKQMYDFVCDKARKHQKNYVAMIADNVVYLWAVTYFSKSNEELGIEKEQRVMPPSSDEVIKNIEKKKKKEELEDKKQDDSQITLFKEEQ